MKPIWTESIKYAFNERLIAASNVSVWWEKVIYLFAKHAIYILNETDAK